MKSIMESHEILKAQKSTNLKLDACLCKKVVIFLDLYVCTVRGLIKLIAALQVSLEIISFSQPFYIFLHNTIACFVGVRF